MTEKDNGRRILTVGGCETIPYPDPKFCLETNNQKVLRALEKLRKDHGSDYRKLNEYDAHIR